jgi:hypothetical protein
MTLKFLEIRDSYTLVPAIAFLIRGADDYLARRAGFDTTPCVFLITLATQRCAYDPFFWGDRTMTAAHLFILNNWESLASGDVVDVEFIKGERPTKKVSERCGE